MKRSPLTVTVLTDTHLYSLKNGFEGKAYDRANSKSQILLAESGEVLLENAPEVRAHPIREETSKTMRGLLEKVVEEGGGHNAYIEGYRIGGKTGTSEKIDEKNEEGVADKRISSFCGIAPADDPQIAILLLMDEPEVDQVTGGLIAAPTVRKMFEDILPYLGIMPQYTEEELSSLEKSVPDVAGLSVPEAREKLKEAGFTPSVIGDGEGVIEQVPRSGQKLAKGGKVLLYTLEEETSSLQEVPDVAGLSLSDATARLQAAGFNIRANGKDLTETQVHAVTQSPAAGALAEAGSVVEVDFVHEAASEWVSVDY